MAPKWVETFEGFGCFWRSFWVLASNMAPEGPQSSEFQKNDQKINKIRQKNYQKNAETDTGNQPKKLQNQRKFSGKVKKMGTFFQASGLQLWPGCLHIRCEEDLL